MVESPGPNTVTGHEVVALWDYAATGKVMSSGDADVSFQKGARMIVLDVMPNDWLKVQGGMFASAPWHSDS